MAHRALVTSGAIYWSSSGGIGSTVVSSRAVACWGDPAVPWAVLPWFTAGTLPHMLQTCGDKNQDINAISLSILWIQNVFVNFKSNANKNGIIYPAKIFISK